MPTFRSIAVSSSIASGVCPMKAKNLCKWYHSDVMGDDGFYVQEYTIHISEPLYPDASLPAAKRSEDLRRRNYKAWADVYESVYQVPLEYTTEHPVEDLEYLKNPEFYEKKASEKGDAGLSLF